MNNNNDKEEENESLSKLDYDLSAIDLKGDDERDLAKVILTGIYVCFMATRRFPPYSTIDDRIGEIYNACLIKLIKDGALGKDLYQASDSEKLILN